MKTIEELTKENKRLADQIKIREEIIAHQRRLIDILQTQLNKKQWWKIWK